MFFKVVDDKFWDKSGLSVVLTSIVDLDNGVAFYETVRMAVTRTWF